MGVGSLGNIASYSIPFCGGGGKIVWELGLLIFESFCLKFFFDTRHINGHHFILCPGECLNCQLVTNL